MSERKTSSSRTQSRPARAVPYSTLLSTADRIKTFFETVCAPFDITGQQYNVLRILRGAEPHGLPTLTIADRVIEKTPGITRMIDRLESKGLVAREIRAHDRRCVYCRITKKGLKLLKLLDEPVEEFNRAAFRGLSPKELEHLVALLLKTRKAHESD
jgi:DNA-binding MarR family transcriptional regulator